MQLRVFFSLSLALVKQWASRVDTRRGGAECRVLVRVVGMQASKGIGNPGGRQANVEMRPHAVTGAHAWEKEKKTGNSALSASIVRVRACGNICVPIIILHPPPPPCQCQRRTGLPHGPRRHRCPYARRRPCLAPGRGLCTAGMVRGLCAVAAKAALQLVGCQLLGVRRSGTACIGRTATAGGVSRAAAASARSAGAEMEGNRVGGQVRGRRWGSDGRCEWPWRRALGVGHTDGPPARREDASRPAIARSLARWCVVRGVQRALGAAYRR